MVDINGICAAYPDGRQVFNNLSFSFLKGESYALLGANGAGKSTLMKCVLGLVPVSKGSISVEGIALAQKNLAKIRAVAGMVFQNSDDQLFCATVKDDILFGLLNLSLSKDETSERLLEYSARFGIEDLLERSPSRLSEGEKKRAAICAVMAMKPKVLFFDEPTAQLDPRGVREISKILGDMKETRIIATHDLCLAEKVCETCLLMQNGEIAAYGKTSEILKNKTLLNDCGLI